MVPHLKFLPETDNGVPVSGFSQSKKWQELLSPDLRVPMVSLHDTHFYIYEPTQLLCGKVLVPIHFYSHKGIVRAKCLKLYSKRQRSSTFQNENDVYILRIHEEPKFDENGWVDVDVSEFHRPFSDIMTEDGRKLIDCGGDLIWRK